jgi:aminoglycoside 2'-N-acetyltransferase I
MIAVSDVCVFTTAELGHERQAAVRVLMNEAFDGDFSDEDWEHALGGWHVLVTADDGALLAHASVVPRRLLVADRLFRSGYVEAVGTAPSRQGTGVGSLAMEAIGELLRRHFELGALGTGRW